MKKLLAILILTLAFAGAYAQQQVSVIPDNKLYSKFQTDDINNMVEKIPSEILYWNWFVYNGYVVKHSTPEATMMYPPLMFFDKDTKLATEEEVAYDEASFNIMAYDFEILPDKTNVYRIGNTGYIVNVLSSHDLIVKYNKFLNHE